VDEDAEALDLLEVCLLEGRRMTPNSSYIWCISREVAEVDGIQRLKDGVADAVVGKIAYELVAAE